MRYCIPNILHFPQYITIDTNLNASHNMATKSKHVFSLENSKPHFESENGSIRKVTVDELPILKNMSIKRLELGPKALREHHCKC
jgi:hypothetical protein